MNKLILVFCLSAAILISGCRKSSPPQASAPAAEQTSPAAAAKSAPAVKSPSVSDSLANIISSRMGWNPILPSFYGKTMPDFTVQDVNGQTHKLSDYRDKNVLVVQWATWCVPCMQEVPTLKALREIMPPEKLAILAISNEPASVVKAAAEKKGMNYTVISHQSELSEPFKLTRAIPSMFFIRPDGTLKFAAEGGLSLGEMKSVILAE